MSNATGHADALFKRAALSDDDLGYPDNITFLAEDLDGCDDLLWDTLKDGNATVLVMGDGVEVLIVPEPALLPFRLIDDFRGRVRVRMMWRHGRRATPALHGRMDRRELASIHGPGGSVFA